MLNVKPPWDIRRKGRAWGAEEAQQRYQLTPEKFEMLYGKLFWSDEDRNQLTGTAAGKCWH